MEKRRIAILGSTGSIGRQTLDVIREHRDLFDVELRDNSLNIVRSIEDVYFDQLVNVIDNAVEHTENYEEQVKELYNIQ